MARRFETDLRGEQAGRDPLDDAPLPDGCGIGARPRCQPPGACHRVDGSHQLDGVLAHDDPEVVFRLGQQTIGIDQRESVGRTQRVPLMHVAVHEPSALDVMGTPTPLGALHGVVDDPAGTRTVEVFPRGQDVVGEPTRRVGARREVEVTRRSPEASGGVAEDAMTFPDRHPEPEHRRSQPFHQQRATIDVVTQQSHATVSVGGPQDGDLSNCSVPRPWDQHLDHRRGAVCVDRLRDVGLGGIAVGPTSPDTPVRLERANELGETNQPFVCADRVRLVANDRRHLEHRTTMPQPERSSRREFSRAPRPGPVRRWVSRAGRPVRWRGRRAR